MEVECLARLRRLKEQEADEQEELEVRRQRDLHATQQVWDLISYLRGSIELILEDIPLCTCLNWVEIELSSVQILSIF